MGDTANKEVGPLVVGVIAFAGLFIAPIVGFMSDFFVVFVGWTFAVGFTVMMWKRNKSIWYKIGLICLLIFCIGLSSYLNQPATP